MAMARWRSRHTLGMMLIRPADPARDAAACAAIYEPYVRTTAISFEERAPSPDQLAERIERFQRSHLWLVAEDDDQLVGYAYACPHRERAAYRWAAEVSVYIDRERHRRGYGRALYGELLPQLAAQGFHLALAGVTLPNDASVALHESLGFTPVGVYRRIGYKLGSWWDVGWWQLSLREPDGDGPPAEPSLT
jgi:L-amino acid N-acyltransferase YncA